MSKDLNGIVIGIIGVIGALLIAFIMDAVKDPAKATPIEQKEVIVQHVTDEEIKEVGLPDVKNVGYTKAQYEGVCAQIKELREEISGRRRWNYSLRKSIDYAYDTYGGSRRNLDEYYLQETRGNYKIINELEAELKPLYRKRDLMLQNKCPEWMFEDFKQMINEMVKEVKKQIAWTRYNIRCENIKISMRNKPWPHKKKYAEINGIKCRVAETSSDFTDFVIGRHLEERKMRDEAKAKLEEELSRLN